MPNTKTNTNQDIHNKTKRPTSLISQGKHITYTYDIHGNIKTKTETPIDKQGNQIAQSQNGLVGYRKSIEFSYNSNNELAKTLTLEDTGLTITKTTTQYHYDAFGRRIAKNSKVERLNKLNQNGQLVRYPTTLLHLSKTQKTQYQTTLMLWEGNRQIQEYTNHHIFTTVYDQDSFEPVARIVQSRQSQDNTHSNGNDKAELFKVYHYHNNHLGTPQELTDELGEVVWCNYEWAWGGRYTHHYTAQSLNNCAILEHELQPIRFQGQFYDVETGLHYNRFRYYDSDVGMFIQRDPIGLLGGINIFQYAPNPIHWVDVFGLAKFKSQNWGTILTENYGVPKPHPSYHAHHIVFKGQWSHRPEIRQQLLRSRHILKKYGININSKANFMWAPKTGHNKENAKAVADALSAEDKVVQVLLKCKCISKTQAKIRIEKALQNIGHKIW